MHGNTGAARAERVAIVAVGVDLIGVMVVENGQLRCGARVELDRRKKGSAKLVWGNGPWECLHHQSSPFLHHTTGQRCACGRRTRRRRQLRAMLISKRLWRSAPRISNLTMLTDIRRNGFRLSAQI